MATDKVQHFVIYSFNPVKAKTRNPSSPTLHPMYAGCTQGLLEAAKRSCTGLWPEHSEKYRL